MENGFFNSKIVDSTTYTNLKIIHAQQSEKMPSFGKLQVIHEDAVSCPVITRQQDQMLIKNRVKTAGISLRHYVAHLEIRKAAALSEIADCIDLQRKQLKGVEEQLNAMTLVSPRTVGTSAAISATEILQAMLKQAIGENLLMLKGIGPACFW